MRTFSYVARDINGKVIKGTEQAEDKNDLLIKLHQKSLFVTSYKDEVAEANKGGRFKFKTKEIAIISRQLASMLTAGITLVRALDILYRQQEKKRAKAEILNIYEEVQKGRSFSETLSVSTKAFPPLFVSMVSAGEISGSLDTIMSRLSDNYAKESKLNNKVRSAMAYPIILLVLIIGVVIALLVFVLPMFMTLFGDPASLPALTRGMLGVSTFVQEKWYIIIFVVALLVLLFLFLNTLPSVKKNIDKLKIKIPKIGKLITTIYTARFARTMANLYSSGIPMVDCIEKSVAVLSNTYISEKFESVVESVKRGEPLSLSIAKVNIFSSMFTSIIYVGEESGSLDEILNKTADFYDEEADSAIGQLVTLIEPIMLIIMGGIVAVVIASIMPALYSSLDNIK